MLYNLRMIFKYRIFWLITNKVWISDNGKCIIYIMYISWTYFTHWYYAGLELWCLMPHSNIYMMYMMHLPLSDIQTLLVISQKIRYLNIIRKLYNIFYTFSALFVFLTDLPQVTDKLYHTISYICFRQVIRAHIICLCFIFPEPKAREIYNTDRLYEPVLPTFVWNADISFHNICSWRGVLDIYNILSYCNRKTPDSFHIRYRTLFQFHLKQID
jgi:hypothetical protein